MPYMSKKTGSSTDILALRETFKSSCNQTRLFNAWMTLQQADLRVSQLYLLRVARFRSRHPTDSYGLRWLREQTQ